VAELHLDDVALASVTRATASKLIAAINARITTSNDQGLNIRCGTTALIFFRLVTT
jgi:hypothetical protein